tara:strand:+ start:636 stop:812 length:177 start_codon:yes stop_codon:yes gene_type:complete
MLDKFNIEPGTPMGFKVEITHPSIHCLIGFQYYDADGEYSYNTFKLHFLWIALRWDWE